MPQCRSAVPLKGSQPPEGCANLHGVLRAALGDGKEALLIVTPLGTANISGGDAAGVHICRYSRCLRYKWRPGNSGPLFTLETIECHFV